MEPAAFMSYVQFNDQHDDGQLSQFRERLAHEVRAQTGGEFEIFQDRNNIAWGQHWERRIDEALDAVTQLVVIVTPSLFRSPACRAEVARFRKREVSLRRDDLILPVYYIGAREMDEADLRAADDMASLLAARQYADWRELRFEPWTSSVVRRAVAQLAGRMRDVFWDGNATVVQVQAPPPIAQPRQSPASAAAEPGTPEDRSSAKTAPPTHVVDAYHRGDFVTVSEAIAAAAPGDRILVRPGLYEEGLDVDKPLEILGDGRASDIVVRARGAEALLFRANIGRVSNLSLEQAGGDGKWYGIDITQGRLELEGCDITSQSLACVAIRNGADPRLRHNVIRDGARGGVYVYGGGLGTLEDNDIFGNRFAGVEIRYGASNPTLRRNRIRDGQSGGVLVCDGGLGTLEDNEISGNAFSAVEVKTGANPTVRNNRIHSHRYPAFYIHDEGAGTFEGNDLSGNDRKWEISADSAELISRTGNVE